MIDQNPEMDTGFMDSKIMILHVDDDPLEQEFILWQLRRNAEDFEIIEAKDGNEALKKIEDKNIECVVSDYQMPKMDGIELLEILRNQNNDIPFILLTGSGDEEILKRAYRCGADQFYSKSEKRNGFSRVINSIRELVKIKRQVD